MHILNDIRKVMSATDMTQQEQINKLLKHAELLTSQIALQALLEWHKAEWVDDRLYNPIVGLTRPSWGNWMGLLQNLTRIRHDVLISDDTDMKKKIDNAGHFNEIIEVLKERVPPELKDEMREASNFMNLSKAQLNSLDLLSLLISMRNYIQHYFPDEKWFSDAHPYVIDILKFLTESLQKNWIDQLDDTILQEPFFTFKENQLYSFFGFDKKGIFPVYVNINSLPEPFEEKTDQVKAFFAALLGEEEYNEKRIKDLLKQLAPEEHRGVLIRDFMIGAPVAEGGFATVHKGINLNNHSIVAVKILKDNPDPTARERFLHEASVMQQFNNDHIVAIYDSGTDRITRTNNPLSKSDEEWYKSFSRYKVKDFIAMEWVDGLTLDDLYHIRKMSPDASFREILQNPGETTKFVKRINEVEDDAVVLEEVKSEFLKVLHSKSKEAKNNEKSILGWFRDSARTLHDIHSQNMIHRDIKPSNIMINSNLQVKIMDFGIARTFREDHTQMTRTGQAIGTMVYMSPEQLMAKKTESELGPATDIYSLCASFYEVFTGMRLYDHDVTDIHIVNAFKTLQPRTPASPIQVNKKMDRQLNDILMGGLQLNPVDRYKSMEALWLDVERCMNSEPILYRKPPFSRRMKLFYKRNRTPVHISVIALILIIGASVIYTMSVIQERNIARSERNIAQARYLAAQASVLNREGQPQLIPFSVQLATESVQRYPNFQATQTLFEGLDKLREPKFVMEDVSAFKISINESTNSLAIINAMYGRPEQTSLIIADLLTGKKQHEFEIKKEVIDMRYIDDDHITVISKNKPDNIAAAMTNRSIYSGIAADTYQISDSSVQNTLNVVSSVPASTLSLDAKVVALIRATEGEDFKDYCYRMSPGLNWDAVSETVRPELNNKVEVYQRSNSKKIFNWHAPGMELLGTTISASPNNKYVGVIRTDSINLDLISEYKDLTERYKKALSAHTAFVGSLVGEIGQRLDENSRIKDPEEKKEANRKLNKWSEDSKEQNKKELQLDYLRERKKMAEEAKNHTEVIHKVYILDTRENRVFWKKSSIFKPTKILFSPDSRLVALYGVNTTLQVWDIIDDRLIIEYTYEMPIGVLSFSNDSRYMVVAIYSNDTYAGGKAHVYDLKNSGELSVSLPHYGSPNSAIFSPDNQFISISSSSVILSQAEKEMQKKFVQSAVSVSFDGVQESADIYVNRFSVRTYNLETGALFAAFPHDGRIGLTTMCDSGKVIITSGGDRNLYRWDFSRNMNVMTKEFPFDVVEVGFNHDGNCFHTVAIEMDPKFGNLLTKETASYLSSIGKIWNSSTGQELCSLQYPEGLVMGKEDWPVISYSKDDKYIQRGKKDTFRFYGTDSSGVIYTMEDCLESKWTFANSGTQRFNDRFMSLNARYASFGRKIVDIRSGEELWSIKVYRDKIRDKIISNDGYEMIMITEDEINHVKTTFIETFKGKRGERIEEPEKRISLGTLLNEIYLSNDQKQFVSVDHSSLSIFNIGSGERLFQKNYGTSIRDVKWSRDDTHIGLICMDGSGIVINLLTGKDMRFAHEMKLNDIDISPDNKYVIFASDDYKAHIWEVETGRKVLELKHDGRIHSVAFSPDGKYVLTGSQDKTAKMWLWSEQDMVELASKFCTRNMTRFEWNKYVQGLEYTRTFSDRD